MDDKPWKQKSPAERSAYVAERWKSLYNVRLDYHPLWQDVIDYLCINRYDIDGGSQQKGKKVGDDVYDAYAILAWRDFCNGVFGYLMSPSLQWFKLRVSPDWIMEDRSVKGWLEECEQTMYASFARSNFYEAAPEYIADGSSIGTASMFCEEDMGERKTVFHVIHPGDIVIAENRHGKIDTVIRRIDKTVRQAIQEFGLDNLSENIQGKAKTNPDDSIEFYHAVFPNEDVETYFRDGQMVPKIGLTNKAFLSTYVEKDDMTKTVKEGGYRLNPYTTWRFIKNSRELYGRSPASNAIVDILKLNQMEKTMLNAAHMAIDPPLQIPEEMRAGGLHVYARGRNYYQHEKRLIHPVPLDLQFQWGIEKEEATRKIIDRHFMSDFFTLLTQAALEGRQLTVPQVMEMQGEKAVMLATVIGRLTSEFLDPIIDRVFDIEMEAGNIPPAPEVLMQMAGKPLEVDYMGPLAQAQRKLFRTQGIYQVIEAVRPMSEMFPEILDNFDADEIAKEIHSASGATVKIMRDPEKRDGMRKARADQMAQEKARQELGDMADKVPQLSKPIEAGSPLELLGVNATEGQVAGNA